MERSEHGVVAHDEMLAGKVGSAYITCLYPIERAAIVPVKLRKSKQWRDGL